jgi:hypothetical protein
MIAKILCFELKFFIIKTLRMERIKIPYQPKQQLLELPPLIANNPPLMVTEGKEPFDLISPQYRNTFIVFLKLSLGTIYSMLQNPTVLWREEIYSKINDQVKIFGKMLELSDKEIDNKYKSVYVGMFARYWIILNLVLNGNNQIIDYRNKLNPITGNYYYGTFEIIRDGLQSCLSQREMEVLADICFGSTPNYQQTQEEAKKMVTLIKQIIKREKSPKEKNSLGNDFLESLFYIGYDDAQQKSNS